MTKLYNTKNLNKTDLKKHISSVRDAAIFSQRKAITLCITVMKAQITANIEF